MFTAKQTTLIPNVGKKETVSTSAFVKKALENKAITTSGNGAKKYSTTGNSFVDQFGKLGSYKSPRTFNEITKDCETLWASNPLMTVLFIFYIRMITRVTTLFSGLSTRVSQKGAELKHEGIMRMIWLHFKAPDTFWKNISIFISIGSWKDIITMLSYDLQYNGWKDKKLDWDKFGNLILSGLENKNTSELLKKYLPSIKANSNCTTLESQADNIIAKWICFILFGNKDLESYINYKKYRKLKSSGTAHEWQQLISQRKFDRIDFAKIHGRALSLLVRGKFLDNSGLKNKYTQWITKSETTNIKYTGFVHELFSVCKKYRSLISMPISEQVTINKQFDTLVKKGGEIKNTNLIVVRDTSGSMGSTATGTNMSCYDIGKALALYFSEFLTGKFANAWIEFNSSAKMHTWLGNTPLEKWYNDKSGFVGGTNFQSVVQLFVKLKQQDIPESEFPSGILCISDSEFNPASLDRTNVETALATLRRGGFSEEYIQNFVIVLWNLQSSYYGKGTGKKFETYGDTPNVFYFSGYSAATVSFLSNDIKTAEELFNEAMNQEILSLIEL